MNTPQMPQQAEKGRIDLRTVLSVLALCGGLAGWVINYVGGIRDSVRDNALQTIYMKEDIRRIDASQSRVQQDVREDLRRIEDKLDRAITDRTADNATVRKWAK